jgi:shikimate kinase
VNWILCGFKGCGKTYFGHRLAQEMKKQFLDTDALLEREYSREYFAMRTCREIALDHGEAFFRDRENRCILSLKEKEDCVIALGGGSILNPDNRTLLTPLGKFLFLDVDFPTLMRRMLSKELPSFLDPKDPQGSFERLYMARIPLYEQVADVQIDCREKSEEEILTELRVVVSNGQ